MIADVVYPESLGTHIDGILRCSRLRWGGGTGAGGGVFADACAA